MRLRLILPLVASACLLAACAGSTQFANPELSIKPVLEPAPTKLAAPCQDPVLLPTLNRAFTQEETESYWTQDRANLIDCRDRKAAEQSYYRKRDAGITAAKE